MKVDIELLKRLRSETSASLQLCKNALLDNKNDYDAAKLSLEMKLRDPSKVRSSSSSGVSAVGFKESGFLPIGFINYLALLGWNSGTDQEIFSLKELEGLFSVGGIQKGGARFDYEKARWINHQHLGAMQVEELYEFDLIKEQLEAVATDQQLNVLHVVKERMDTLTDLAQEITWMEDPQGYDEAIVQKLSSKGATEVLDQIHALVIKQTDLQTLKETLMPWAKENEINTGLMMQSLRIALVGKLAGPDVFQICSILGKVVTLNRIGKAIAFFNSKT